MGIKMSQLESTLAMLTHDTRDVFNVCSLCSGCDIAFFAAATLVASVKKQAGHACNVYSCECDPGKQRFLKKFVHAHPWGKIDPGCIFQDIHCVGGQRATCYMHEGKDCAFPTGAGQPVLLSAGFSCRTLSPLSQNRGHEARHALRDKKGSSGTTFDGLCAHLEAHAIPLVILENVPQLLSASSSNYSTLVERLTLAGYCLAARVVNSRSQGSCLHRRRAYVLALHAGRLNVSVEEGNAAVAQAVEKMCAINIDPVVEFGKYLLDEGNPVLQKELADLSAKGRHWDPEGRDWPEKHESFCEARGISPGDLRLPGHLDGNPWCAVLTERVKQVLSHGLSSRPAPPTLEVSQSLDRKSNDFSEAPSSDDGARRGGTSTGDKVFSTCGALLPKSIKWIPGRSRLLTAYESMALQCFPMDAVPGVEAVPRSTLRSLAGNAFNGASYMAALVALLSSLPVAARVTPQSDEDEDDDAVVARAASLSAASFSV